MNAIEFHEVSEKYRVKFVRDKRVFWEEVWALEGVNLSVEQGTVLGVVGPNGAGKTTLLKLVAGMLMPDKGEVRVRGKVSTLMELGAGFNPEFTGRENIALNARTYGIEGAALEEQTERIISFADIGKFIDAPVKYYSLGMYLRLAFALAVFVNPDVFLIDDVLSVGDEEAQLKCAKKILALKKEGKTLVVVSHDMAKIRQLCDHVILLAGGRIVETGTPDKVVSSYLGMVGKKDEERRRAEEKARQEKARQERERIRAQGTIATARCSLHADIERKVIRFYYGGKEITGEQGFYLVFQTAEKLFHSREAAWDVAKVSEEELVLTLRFTQAGLSQTLRFSFPEENSLHIKIDMDLKSPLSFIYQDTSLEIRDLYRAWATATESGTLDAGQGLEETYPIRWKNNKVSDVMLRDAVAADYPDIAFVSYFEPGPRLMSLSKRSEAGAMRIGLNSSLLIAHGGALTKPGRYVYFRGEISFGGGIVPRERPGGCVAQLTDGELGFIFDNGRGRILAGGKELTTGLSLYTSVRSSGLWLDSSQALWKIEKHKDREVVVTGHWPRVPISQQWRVSLDGQGRIAWQAQTQVHQEAFLEIEQANLMLTTGYRHWAIAESSRGFFSDDFTKDYDILPFRFWYGETLRMEIQGEGLPSLVFARGPEPFSLKGLVENTDSYYRARLLQYQKTNAAKVPAGSYLFLKGVIEIG